jgi:Caspase domain
VSKSTHTESRYSVCIGINQYHPSAKLSPLRYAERDASAMDELFGQVGFGTENRRLLLAEAATLDAVNEALNTILIDTAGENDLVVFYFAGHSLPLVINQRQVEEQRPVLSGVQQDTFELVYRSDFAQPSTQAYEETPSDRRHDEKGERLRAMFAGHSSFLRDRLESFVGRETELSEIHQCIQEHISTGGYVTITGQAGQGKSSVIAQLVKNYIVEQGSQARSLRPY